MTDSTVQSSTVQSKPALQHPPVSAAAVEPVPTQLAQNAQPRLPAKSIAAVRPSAGDVATIELLAGHALKLHFELDEVAVRRLADGDLELLFGDGGKLVLRHYLQLADHGSQIAIPVLRKDGTPTDLTALVAPVASPENAGDEIADGGHFMSSYDAGALGEGIEHLAGLGDEDFSFAATAPIDRLQTNAFNRPPPPQPLAPSGPETGSNQLDVNAAPAARTDAATTDENVPVAIDVLPNDDDIDGDRPTVLAAGEGARGTTGVGTDGRIVYTPDRDFEGTDSFVYTITDGNGGTSTGTVNVTVNGVNVAPAAGNDEATTDENVPVTINVLSNDSDPDGDTPSVLAAGNGTNGTTGVGTDGQIVYTPNAEFEGTDSFVYTIVDGDGGTSTATVNVSVIGENEVPFAANDAATTDEDIAVTVDVLANDTDSDGGTLAILGAGDGLNGTTTFGTDGRIVYTPNAEFSGTDNFIYTITDGNGGMATATVNVTVLTVNDPPIAGNDAATTDEDAPVTVEILSNDGDIDGDPLTVASIGAAGNGSALLQSDGTVVYTPNAEFSGTDSFGYTIFDGDGGSASATATVTVNGVNDLPLAADDTASVNEDAPIGAPVNVLLNDTDADGNPLTVIAFGAAAHGSMFASGGHIIYTPEANFFGTDSFVYTISDGNGGTATATVVVTVLGLNDPPAPADDDATTMEDTPIAVNVLANDGDPDGDALTVTSAFGAAHGSVVPTNGTVIYTPDPGFEGTDSFTYFVYDGNGGSTSATVQVTVLGVNDAPLAGDDGATMDENTMVTVNVLANDSDPDGDTPSVLAAENGANGTTSVGTGGQIVYTPNADFEGTDSFVYTVDDGNGGTATATVAVTVNGVNQLPIADGDDATTDENVAVTVDVLANDSDPDGDTPSVQGAADGVNGTTEIGTDGRVVYTPDAGFDGTDSFTYTIADANGATTAAVVSITVHPANDAPVAETDSATTGQDIAVTVDLLANDSDPNGDALSVIDASGGARGFVVLNGDGTVTYTPFAGESGTDSFTYTITDGNGATAFGTVNVAVEAAGGGPLLAIDDGYVVYQTEQLMAGVAGNDTVQDGPALFGVLEAAQNGSIAFELDGSFIYTPYGSPGTDSFTYVVVDTEGRTASATVTVTILGVNQEPEAGIDYADTEINTPVSIDLIGNDYDVDGDPLSVIAAAGALHGTVDFTTDGIATYTPNPGFTGLDSFSYTIVDGNGGTATEFARIYVTEAGVNNPPEAFDDSYLMRPGEAAYLTPLENDFDVNHDWLTVTGVSDAGVGTVSLDEWGEVIYQADPTYVGTDSFTYTIDDGNGGTSSATFVVTLEFYNDAPWAEQDDSNGEQFGIPVPVNEQVELSVLNNDYDPNDDPLTIIGVDEPPHGSVTITTNGTLLYISDPNYIGYDEFHYTISDGNGGTASAFVLVDVYGSDGDFPTDDLSIGTEFTDYFYGDGGIDTMLGRGGADYFYVGAGGPANYDRILDFDPGEGDRLDISALITDIVDAGNLNDYVQFVENGGHTEVLVSANGQPGNFQLAAELVGITGLNPIDLLNGGNLAVVYSPIE